MPSPLLTVLPGVLRAIAKLFGGRVGEAAEAIVAGNLPPEKRAELTLALQEHEQEMKRISLDELKTVLSETQTMVVSEDTYVRRARPTGLYVAYAISLSLTIALVVGVKVDATAILTLCAPLYGAQGYYMHLRTREKLNGGGNGG